MIIYYTCLVLTVHMNLLEELVSLDRLGNHNCLDDVSSVLSYETQ